MTVVWCLQGVLLSHDWEANLADGGRPNVAWLQPDRLLVKDSGRGLPIQWFQVCHCITRLHDSILDTPKTDSFAVCSSIDVDYAY